LKDHINIASSLISHTISEDTGNIQNDLDQINSNATMLAVALSKYHTIPASKIKNLWSDHNNFDSQSLNDLRNGDYVSYVKDTTDSMHSIIKFATELENSLK
jgi:hypothetical protein